jgi:hypothetical protein
MGWLPAFLFLYAVLFFFERKRMNLDWFLILVVALVPALVFTIKLFVNMLAPLPRAVDIAVELAAYPITFLLLWKMVGLSVRRAGVYTGALFVFQMALGVVVFLLSGQS